MKRKTILKIIFVICIMLTISTLMPKNATAGTIKPSDITGLDEKLEMKFIDKLQDFIQMVGVFLSVAVMMIIGIKYMTGTLEEKANYKKTMMPYVIGCFILFSASVLAPKMIEAIKASSEVKTTEEVGNMILGFIRLIGTVIAVGILMMLGVKYMMGSAGEKASYKKTMIPYLIGAVLLFAAVNLTSAIYDASMTDGSGGRRST